MMRLFIELPVKGHLPQYILVHRQRSTEVVVLLTLRAYYSLIGLSCSHHFMISGWWLPICVISRELLEEKL
jgi:hypothetical protein